MVNKFNVGDRVAVYDWHNKINNTTELSRPRITGIILEICGADTITVKGLSLWGKEFISCFHPKQCRKLVKKKKHCQGDHEDPVSWDGTCLRCGLKIKNKQPKFKVGDLVKIKNTNISVSILEIHSDFGGIWYKISSNSEGRCDGISREDGLEQENCLEPKKEEPKFKIGDFVTHVRNYFIIGKIVNIVTESSLVVIKFGDGSKIFDSDEIQKLNIKVEE